MRTKSIKKELKLTDNMISSATDIESRLNICSSGVTIINFINKLKRSRDLMAAKIGVKK